MLLQEWSLNIRAELQYYENKGSNGHLRLVSDLLSLLCPLTHRFRLLPLESRHSQDFQSWISNMFDTNRLGPDHSASEQIGEVEIGSFSHWRCKGIWAGNQACTALRLDHLDKSQGEGGLGGAWCIRQWHTKMEVLKSHQTPGTYHTSIILEFKGNNSGRRILGGVNGSSRVLLHWRAVKWGQGTQGSGINK